MGDAKELTTERLSMRRPVPTDLDAIFAITGDPRTTSHNPSDAIRSKREARDLYGRWNEQWDQYGFGYWVVRRHDADRTLGFCGLKVMSYRSGWVLNLFYRFVPSCWGHGIASEAATAAVGWAAEHAPAWSVIARVRPDNIASQRVALKAGLVRAPYLDGDGYDGVDWVFVSVRPPG